MLLIITIDHYRKLKLSLDLQFLTCPLLVSVGLSPSNPDSIVHIYKAGNDEERLVITRTLTDDWCLLTLSIVWLDCWLLMLNHLTDINLEINPVCQQWTTVDCFMTEFPAACVILSLGPGHTTSWLLSWYWLRIHRYDPPPDPLLTAHTPPGPGGQSQRWDCTES